MGVPVDQIQAKVAATALAKRHTLSMNDALDASMDSMKCESRWKWLRQRSKRFYKTYARAGRGVLWMYSEAGRKKKRTAVACVGYMDGAGSRLRGSLEILRQVGCGEIETIGGVDVFASQHALEAMFRKAGRLDRSGVQIDVYQAVGSLFLMVAKDPEYWDGGAYEEYEILTENGMALAVRNEGEAAFTITTWVPNPQLRDEQRAGWSVLGPPTSAGVLVQIPPKTLPRISTCVHRQGLAHARHTALS